MDPSMLAAVCCLVGMVIGAAIALTGFHFGYRTAMTKLVRHMLDGSVTTNQIADGAVIPDRTSTR